MSFTEFYKKQLRATHLFAITSIEKDGKPCQETKVCWNRNTYFSGEKMPIPSSYDLFDQMKKEIMKILPNCKISRENPKSANCIIRTYELRHYQYDEGFIFNLYGADIYTKEKFNHGFVTERFGRKAQITHDDEAIQIWIYQDDSIILHPRFVDFYVRILC